jgi:hypothetical protein
LFVPDSGESPFLSEAGGCAVRLQMRGVDHDPLGPSALRGQRHENAVKHAEQTPPYEAIVKSLMRAIRFWRVLPLQTMLDHVDDSADHAPVIDTRNAVRKWKKWR